MVVKDSKEVEKADVAKLDDQKLKLKAVDQSAPEEGFYNETTGEFAAKAGGLIDLETGIYVPPGKDSLFDQNSGVYVSNETGDIDKETGQYVAPKGLKLDATQGFVVEDDKAIKDKKNELLAQTQTLNEVIAKDLVVGKKVEKPLQLLSSSEIFTKNSVEISLSSFEYKNDSQDYHFRDPSSRLTTITWNHSAGGKWQPVTSFARRSTQVNTNLEERQSSMTNLGFGIRRYLTRRWSIVGLVGIEQEKFLVNDNSGTVTTGIEKITLTKLKAIFEGDLIKSKRHTIDTNIALQANLNKDTGIVKVDTSLGLKFDLGYKYWWKQKRWLRVSIWNETQEYKVYNSSFDSNQKINLAGIELGVGLIF